MARFNRYKEDVDLSALRSYCEEHGRVCRYSKGDVILQQGEIGRYIGFVLSGYLKYTTVTDSGNEAVVGFAFEGECVCDYNNSYQGLPSEISIVAGGDTKIMQSEFKKVKSLIETSMPAFHGNVSDALFREIYKRYLEFYRKTPTQRYIDLLSKHPDIFDIVTMRDIASYLQVTPVHLCRIRKKMFEFK